MDIMKRMGWSNIGLIKEKVKSKKDKKVDFDILLKQLKFIIADINNDEPFKSEVYDKVNCETCPYFYLCR